MNNGLEATNQEDSVSKYTAEMVIILTLTKEASELVSL